MCVKYPTYVNLTSSSEEHPNERTPSPPPRNKSLSPPQAPSKSISSKSTHYTSSSSPMPKVDDVSLVDGVFDGAFGGDGEQDFVMGEGVRRGSLGGIHGSRRKVKMMSVKMIKMPTRQRLVLIISTKEDALGSRHSRKGAFVLGDSHPTRVRMAVTARAVAQGHRGVCLFIPVTRVREV
ncbi:hypothetical protein Tco_1316150 [Tanacetum coccineum]